MLLALLTSLGRLLLAPILSLKASGSLRLLIGTFTLGLNLNEDILFVRVEVGFTRMIYFISYSKNPSLSDFYTAEKHLFSRH